MNYDGSNPMSTEIYANCIESARVNLGNTALDVHQLELILTVLRVRGHVTVEGCAEVMSLMELGAHLHSLQAVESSHGKV